MSTEFDTTLPLRLTEQLRDDLLRILALAENTPDGSAKIAAHAKHSLRVADAYLLAHQQTQLPLEPLTATSVLEDVAHDMYQLAKEKQATIHVDSRGAQRPVLAHRQSMHDLLLLVASAVLARQPAGTPLILGTHRSSHGTVVGAFGSGADDIKLNQINSLKQTSNAEVLLSVASKLGDRMQAQVKGYHHVSVAGFGATFMQSRQLQLLV